jgi:nucleoside-diphosphate-sugar epimerase
VVHLAAREHVMQDRVDDPLEAFREVNMRGTLTLAQQAAAAGVQRFVFLSSIKVNGEVTVPGQAFSEVDESKSLKDREYDLAPGKRIPYWVLIR